MMNMLTTEEDAQHYNVLESPNNLFHHGREQDTLEIVSEQRTESEEAEDFRVNEFSTKFNNLNVNHGTSSHSKTSKTSSHAKENRSRQLDPKPSDTAISSSKNSAIKTHSSQESLIQIQDSYVKKGSIYEKILKSTKLTKTKIIMANKPAKTEGDSFVADQGFSGKTFFKQAKDALVAVNNETEIKDSSRIKEEDNQTSALAKTKKPEWQIGTAKKTGNMKLKDQVKILKEHEKQLIKENEEVRDLEGSNVLNQQASDRKPEERIENENKQKKGLGMFSGYGKVLISPKLSNITPDSSTIQVNSMGNITNISQEFTPEPQQFQSIKKTTTGKNSATNSKGILRQPGSAKKVVNSAKKATEDRSFQANNQSLGKNDQKNLLQSSYTANPGNLLLSELNSSREAIHSNRMQQPQKIHEMMALNSPKTDTLYLIRNNPTKLQNELIGSPASSSLQRPQTTSAKYISASPAVSKDSSNKPHYNIESLVNSARLREDKIFATHDYVDFLIMSKEELLTNPGVHILNLNHWEKIANEFRESTKESEPKSRPETSNDYVYQKSVDWMNERASKIEQLKHSITKEEMQHCTFQPWTNTSSSKQLSGKLQTPNNNRYRSMRLTSPSQRSRSQPSERGLQSYSKLHEKQIKFRESTAKKGSARRFEESSEKKDVSKVSEASAPFVRDLTQEDYFKRPSLRISDALKKLQEK